MTKRDEATVRGKFVALRPVMDERLTRLWAGAVYRPTGRVGTVTRATPALSATYDYDAQGWRPTGPSFKA